ncbi:nickel pincer cofactor biosynthesis protein LarC [Candidatus Caldatribacterium saccharofermentans]|uniref:nickel pincer cofactor biosynthesis protein LarC n=1 Tax=Candidatus Caldatribacterium saccharofermentans TaxID=1454753 RepID=UPI003D051BE7
MFLGALLDLGRIDISSFVASLHEFLPLSLAVDIRKVHKKGIAATQVIVSEPDPPKERKAKELFGLLAESSLPEALREKALKILRRIAEAEGKIHGLLPDDVHLHEIGGGDTLVDVVGTLYALDLLGVQAVYASPIPTGRGFIHTAHGILPVPAPATLELLRGIPVYTGTLEGELTTPTGAALVSSLAQSFGPCPPLVVQEVGYGAGMQDLEVPNVLRVILGEREERATPEKNVLLETNIDDMSPQILEYLTERLFKAGALDVFVTPIYMKKQRPAFTLSVLSPLSLASLLRTIIFEETTTLGIREYEVTKWVLPRTVTEIPTPWGTVRGKAVTKHGRVVILPEYEDCKKIAAQTGLPLQEVFRIAQESASRKEAPTPGHQENH